MLASDSFSGSGTIQTANTFWSVLMGGSMSITPEKRARMALSSTTTLYEYDLGEDPPADYEVSLDIYVASANTDAIGPAGRIQSSSVYYHGRYNLQGNNWELYRFGPTQLLGSWSENVPVGATRRATLRMEGSSISLLVDGVTRIAVTNAGIALPGRPGIRGITGGASDVSGLHVDNWLAESIESEAGINLAAVVQHMRTQGMS